MDIKEHSQERLLIIFKDFLASFASAVMWSITDRPFLNPLWNLYRRLFFSRKKTKRLFTIFSINLQITEIREIGRYEDGAVRSFPSLRIGITIECFQSQGSFPKAQTLLKSLRITPNTLSSKCLNMRNDNQSWPGVLFLAFWIACLSYWKVKSRLSEEFRGWTVLVVTRNWFANWGVWASNSSYFMISAPLPCLVLA